MLADRKGLSKLRFDLSQEGLHCVLKPWQADVMHFLWEKAEPQDSRAVYEHLQTADIEGAKSRASVINFLNYMVDEGFLDYVEETGKGGHHRVYSLKELSETETKFRAFVAEMFYGEIRTFQLDSQGGKLMSEKRIVIINGCKHLLSLTELRTKLDGTPTKHVLAVWNDGEANK